MNNNITPDPQEPAEPIRRERRLRVTADDGGNPVLQPVDDKSIGVSAEGSIDSTTINYDNFWHCGCPTHIPAGGRCAVGGCGRISCQQCAGRCSRCSVPACLEHSVFMAVADGKTARVCLRCHAALKRKQVLHQIGRLLLYPFVDFGGKEGP